MAETLPETNYKQLDIGLGKGNSAVTPHILSGDINEDSIISVLDVPLLQMICSGSHEPTKTQELAADYNDDGKIDVNDATALQMAQTNPNKDFSGIVCFGADIYFSFFIFPARTASLYARLSFACAKKLRISRLKAYAEFVLFIHFSLSFD